MSLHLRFAVRAGQEPAPSCRGSTADPSRWLRKGQRARHGTEHPRFGEIDHAHGLGCVDACPSSRRATTTAAQWKARLRRRRRQTARLGFGSTAARREGCSSTSRVAERKPQEAKQVSGSYCARAVRDPVPGRSSRYRPALRAVERITALGAASFRDGCFLAHCGYVPFPAGPRRYRGVSPQASA